MCQFFKFGEQSEAENLKQSKIYLKKTVAEFLKLYNPENWSQERKYNK